MLDSVFSSLKSLHSADGLIALIQSGGLVALIAIVFAETGLLIGFFLPGDSLLITAGILSAPTAVGGGLFSLPILIICLMLAAILGDQVNFLIGRKSGHMVFDRPDGRFIKRKYYVEAHEFYEKHGGLAIILARFVPILRTFVPFIAGVAEMNYRRFVVFNIIGGSLWVISLCMIGYLLGHTPWAQKLHQVIIIVVVVSVLPLVIGMTRRLLKKNTVVSSQ